MSPTKRPANASNSGSNSSSSSSSEQGHNSNKMPRRSTRPPVARDMFLKQRADFRKNIMEWEVDEVRGYDQPGGLEWSEAEIRFQDEENKGTQIFDEHLRPLGWKHSKRTHSVSGHVFRAPGITKKDEMTNVNTFLSYNDIYKQYVKDGNRVEQILARASGQPQATPAVAAASAAAQHSTRVQASASARAVAQEQGSTGGAATPTENRKSSSRRQAVPVPVKSEPTTSPPASTRVLNSLTRVLSSLTNRTNQATVAAAVVATPVAVKSEEIVHPTSDDSTLLQPRNILSRLGPVQRLKRIEEILTLEDDEEYSQILNLKGKIAYIEQKYGDPAQDQPVVQRLAALERDYCP